MKPIRKIIVLAFIAIAILAMFLPVATFHDNSANALTADIEKQEGKVKSAQDQLDRWINGGKKSEAEYPEEPLFATPRQAREAEEERQRREMARHRAQLRAWAASFNAAFEQRRREGAAGRGRDDG